MPFSLGPMSCPGKNLALMVLRLFTAALVGGFELGFAPGEDERRVLDESCNTVTNNPGPLWLVVRRREN